MDDARQRLWRLCLNRLRNPTQAGKKARQNFRNESRGALIAEFGTSHWGVAALENRTG